MHVQGCHYTLVLMTVLLGAELSRDTSSVSSVLERTEDEEVVKYGFLLIFLAGCYCRYEVQLLKEEGSHS